MAAIGKFNKLKVTRCVAAGIFVNAEQLGELKIPGWDVTGKAEKGDEIDVFLFLDSAGQPVATMRKPLAMPGEVARLKVSAVESDGALLEWGMPKQLWAPAQDQQQKMVRGFSYVVYVYFDPKSQRINASTKLEKYLTVTPGGLQLDQEVELIICDESDLGYRAVINNIGLGFLYNNDLFQKLKIGEKRKGYVKNIREDGRVDLCLQKPGFEKIDDLGKQILAKVRASGGFLAITDKSPAEEIYQLFAISKKNYKKAVGGLYKKGLVILEEKGVRLVRP
ncbi:MAG: GntR family transcriptional regulator [Candidatus Riflebacteria bacterium]|nr:GntR family transcriptional regulator [Candidatus Riflebacteria bacterium]